MNKLKESEGLAGPCSPFSSNLLSADTVSRPIHTSRRWVKRGHRHYSKLFTSGYEIVSASRPRLPSGDILWFVHKDDIAGLSGLPGCCESEHVSWCHAGGNRQPPREKSMFSHPNVFLNVFGCVFFFTCFGDACDRR